MDISRSGSRSTCDRRAEEPRPSAVLVGRVLFIFLDGVGIGAQEPEQNPFFVANLPILRAALGGELPHLEEPRLDGDRGTAFPMDACLGVEGTPQSGTGQVALLTGRNAPQTFGRHFGPWPPVRLRPILEAENFLSMVM